ncbi:hypothetical protein BsWGS_26285 [Bradybaena similaris]
MPCSFPLGSAWESFDKETPQTCETNMAKPVLVPASLVPARSGSSQIWFQPVLVPANPGSSQSVCESIFCLYAPTEPRSRYILICLLPDVKFPYWLHTPHIFLIIFCCFFFQIAMRPQELKIFIRCLLRDFRHVSNTKLTCEAYLGCLEQDIIDAFIVVHIWSIFDHSWMFYQCGI